MKFAIAWGLTFAIGSAVYVSPAGATELSDTPQSECPNAKTTTDMNRCYVGLLHRAEARRERYLAVANTAQADRPQEQAAIRKASAAFIVYRDAKCGAVYREWEEGTIRDVMTLGCEIDLTDRRTHTIWVNWLTYMDSTPPRLPEPEPTARQGRAPVRV